MRRAALGSLAFALSFFASPAWADAPPADPATPAQSAATAPAASSPDVAAPDGAERSNPPERGFLFAVEPSVPEPLHAVVSAGMGNVTRTGEERPVGAGVIIPTVGGEIGILQRLSVYAEGGVVSINQGNPGGLASPFMLDTGFHILLTDPSSRTWRLSLRPSYSYDVDGASAANLTGTLAWDYRGFRVISSFMASHTFQGDADGVDLQATVGANYALPLGLRLGVESVISDLEELGAPGAEGGASAFAGPTAGWSYDRFQLVLGPAWGVTPGALTDSFLFRGAVSIRL